MKAATPKKNRNAISPGTSKSDADGGGAGGNQVAFSEDHTNPITPRERRKATEKYNGADGFFGGRAM